MEAPFPGVMKSYRDFVGLQFLRGQGIEIGAGHTPTAVVDGLASVKYVDYQSLEDLQQTYGVSDAWKAPDVIDDGQALDKFPASSLDFIIANHVLEHTENPLGVLLNWFSKIRKDGIVYVAIPERRFSFDHDRPLTDLAHFVRDHEEGPQVSRLDHFREYARLVSRVPDNEIDSTAEKLIATDYRIHFHVWDQQSFLEFLLLLKSTYHAFDIEHYGRNTNELLAVLRV